MGKKFSEMTIEELTLISSETERLSKEYDKQVQAILKKGGDTDNVVKNQEPNQWMRTASEKRNKLYALHTLVDNEIETRLLNIYVELFEKN